ncbi:MAG: hypothetical protein P4L16_06390 [Chlamydiales bacterium]|nr:hypothetical protein [Chlamydiales bacterium]
MLRKDQGNFKWKTICEPVRLGRALQKIGVVKMESLKKELGKELKANLSDPYDPDRIARWADHVRYTYRRELSNELYDMIDTLTTMSCGPEFVLPQEEVRSFAEQLITEGEREELGEALPEIEEIAQDLLEDNWLMCPLCQEAWQDYSKYAMVYCPKCNNKLHNPKFKPSI